MARSESTLPDPTRRVLTPSQLNAEAQVVLEENFGLVWIEGEISNFSRPASGHWYFTLKDRSAQVRCAMFRGRNNRVRFTPEAGMQVLLRARVSLYVGRGEFQLIVDAIEPAGEGALRLAFDQLRRRLADEGLFDDDRKRALPPLPRRIAVITSATGAAIRDVRSVLARRWPLAELILIPTAVQGEAATAEIVAAFDRLARLHATDPASAPDLVIAGRGGGSLEDLWCFNEERVARAIAACPVPVVSAVGHETDFTIADFTADVRAATPSAAAELVSPDAEAWQRTLSVRARQIEALLRRRLTAAAEQVTARRRRLRGPGVLIAERTQRVDELGLRLERRVAERIDRQRERLQQAQRRLTAASPRGGLLRDQRLLAQLRRRLAQAGPATTMAARRLALATAHKRLLGAEARQRDGAHRELRRLAGALQALSPLAVVDRGYALLARPAPGGERFGELVTSSDAVAEGDRVHAHLREGVLALRVEGPVTRGDPEDPAADA